MKKMFLIGVLSLSSLAILSAKTYQITVTSVLKAGSLQLKPGQYKVKVEGSNAVFTDVTTQKTFTAPVKVEEGTKKYDSTIVQTTKEGDGEVLQEIDLEGSKTKLAF